MGLRFRKSIKLAPGIRVNLSSKSAGLSIGGKGLRYSVNTRGRKTTTIGIPGTGISYSTSSGSRRKRTYRSSGRSTQKSQIQAQRQQEKELELQENKRIVDEYNNYIKMLKTVHTECDDSILWENIKNEPAPFILGEIGPKEKSAIEKEENFKPNLLHKFIPSLEEKKKKKLSNSIISAHEEDVEDYTIWESSVKIASRILDGDISAYYEAIEEANPFEDLLEYGSGFEFGTDSPDYIEAEFTVKSDTVVPHNSKVLTKSGNISEKPLSKTMYYDLVQDYVCSCAIRIARELFAIIPVSSVKVHATDNILNTQTGREENVTILSVRFTKDKFADVDFDRIDPSDFTETFERNMFFKKTSGFQAVTRIEN